MERQKQIVRVSVLGIAANAVLAAFKAVVGLVTGSIAVTLDAVNNLSDALSSVITIVGTKLASRAPDKKHPYGYGRIENVTSVAIAVIVLLAGVTSFRESVVKILHPESAEYTAVSLVIIAAAVLVKFFLGRYVNSDSLVASGSDALFDSIISLSTLVAAAISLLFHVSIEGWLGAVISAVIVKAGIEILIDSLNAIIGYRIDSELSRELKDAVAAYDEVLGAYDLSLHRYGPEKIIGSVHIEVDDAMTARELHALTRRITTDILAKYGVLLTLGIYASNTRGEAERQLKADVQAVTAEFPEILELHGFYVDPETERVSFDLIVSFDADAHAVCAQVRERLLEKYPNRTFDIVLDSDISD